MSESATALGLREECRLRTVVVGLVLERELESVPAPGSGEEGSMALGFVPGLAPEFASENTTTPEFGKEHSRMTGFVLVLGPVPELHFGNATARGSKENRKLRIVVVDLVPDLVLERKAERVIARRPKENHKLSIVVVGPVLELHFESVASPGLGEEHGLSIVVVALVPLAPGSERKHSMVLGFALVFGLGPELESEMVAAQGVVVGKIAPCKYSLGWHPKTVEHQRQADGG